jgi:sugar/nucleoside kinase (ribokinase family)
MSTTRTGITSGGNWIVDKVKTVDRLPEHGMLATILHETQSTGGAPANVLADLARLQAPFPLAGVGVVGNDEAGRYVVDSFRALGVDMTAVRTTAEAPTSYTDVMSDQATAVRTFYHCRGANSLFGPADIPVDRLTCRLFHLGYILLLDAMDTADAETGTVAARALRALQAAGIRTSVDVVSEDSDRFARLVPPALDYTDYLICNEIEAGRATGRAVRSASNSLQAGELRAAVADLCAGRAMRLVAVHMPEGVYMRDGNGTEYAAGSLKLPPGFIRGTVGAGDAFCAGMLYGLHEDWSMDRCAALASCCAAASLTQPGASEGVQPAEACLALAERFGYGPPPVRL